jgi:NDP-sugar pyrophosphorylase family protein
MKAMILAAGRGTRLGDITQSTPKCLVQAGGKTMLEHVVIRLKLAGVSSIMINLHHLADEVESYVRSKSSFGLDIHFSREAELLETGGGLRNVESFFSDGNSFFLHNADIYSDVNLTDMFSMHTKSGALATLGVMRRQTSRYLLFDDQDLLIGWENPKDGRSDLVRTVLQPNRLAFSGIQVLSTGIFEFMRDEPARFTTISIFVKAARQNAAVKAYRMDGNSWHDVGTPESLEELRRKLG